MPGSLGTRLAAGLPPLSPAGCLKTTRLSSPLGRLDPSQALLATRPLRSPHHTISGAGMVGGGSTPAPGAISLAHRGDVQRHQTSRQQLARVQAVLERDLRDAASRALSAD